MKKWFTNFPTKKKDNISSTSDDNNYILGRFYQELSSQRALWRRLAFIGFGLAFMFGVLALVHKQHHAKYTPVFIQQLADGTMITREANNIIDFAQKHPAVVRSDLANYVRLYESWDKSLFARHAYLLCGKGSESNDATCKVWQNNQKEENPNSFLNRYGFENRRDVSIIAVNFIEQADGRSSKNGVPDINIATVIFSANSISSTGLSQDEGNYKATIAYHYIGTPSDKIQAFNNPLGFQVTDYSVEALAIGGSKK